MSGPEPRPLADETSNGRRRPGAVTSLSRENTDIWQRHALMRFARSERRNGGSITFDGWSPPSEGSDANGGEAA